MAHVDLIAAIRTYEDLLATPDVEHGELALAVADLIGIAERVLSAEIIAATTQPTPRLSEAGACARRFRRHR